MGSIAGRDVCRAGCKGPIRRPADRRSEDLAVELLAAAGTPGEVDSQQQTHPVSGRGRLLVRRSWRSDAEQLARAGQLFLFDAVGQEAVMADAEEAIGQDVLEEAAYEFLGSKEIRLKPVATPSGLPDGGLD